MTATGWVLAGGRSSRMGRDKALLPYRGTTLIEHIARAVRDATGNVAVIGQSYLPVPTYPDQTPGLGPIGGLSTALSLTTTDWNLIVACDMPGITSESLGILLKTAELSSSDAVAAASPAGLEPLCAVYHRRCLPIVTRAIERNQLKMFDLLAKLEVESPRVDAAVVANANTPAEWAEFENEPK